MASQELADDGTAVRESSRLSVTAPDGGNRCVSRSPHPYHRRGMHLPHDPASVTQTGDTDHLSPPRRRTPKPSSDSGTEADDEGPGLLKGLPAPHSSALSRLLLRDQDGEALFASRGSKAKGYRRDSNDTTDTDSTGRTLHKHMTRRKKREVIRRVLETALVLAVGTTVFLQEDVRVTARIWDKDLLTFSALVVGLYALFPLRLHQPGFHLPSWGNAAFLPFSPDFDPAPLIYPILLPVLTALSLGRNCRHLILPNIILSLSSLPSPVIPYASTIHGSSLVHWAVTVIPLIISELPLFSHDPVRPGLALGIDREILVLTFPFQRALVSVLHFLTTTSLLYTEVQLLATGLINLLLFSKSPQAEILKALFWVGGVLILVTCTHVLRWEVMLARVPSWKFRRSTDYSSGSGQLLKSLDRQMCQKLSSGLTQKSFSDSDDLPNESFIRRKSQQERRPQTLEGISVMANSRHDTNSQQPTPLRKSPTAPVELPSDTIQKGQSVVKNRRITSQDDEYAHPRTTPRGRRKRIIGPNLRSFLSLTLAQAKVRKWAYAIYTYAAILLIILGPVRYYVSANALRGNEPFGWAVGYLFGNNPSLRLWLVKNNLNGWACIPSWQDTSSCQLGWMEHLRRDTFGEANTRLIISGYYLLVLSVGMLLVFRLSNFVEVDTRRKVFHGMMASILLPTIYIDPAFSALALALILAIFLLLDLFRASQLPPISKPLTYFLSPYADGRDHRGPVIVSHMFLLIGCAIPLWLSLAGARRSGDVPWEGWEVQGRDTSMVSGVICVGMGDAAASLVGRRYGRRRWFWGGGKSLEGSFAFAAAVMFGLLIARPWLILGGWDANTPLSTSIALSSLRAALSKHAWASTLGKSALVAAGSSFMEAVLTGGNDNVVVPLVMWLLVRGLNI